MSIAVVELFPPGVKGDGVVEDVEPHGVMGFLHGCVVGRTPYSVASRASEANICTHSLVEQEQQVT